MISVGEYEELKSLVDELKQKRDQNEGALKEKMKTLWEKFKCKTVEEAKRALEKREAKETQLEESLEAAEAAFKKKWAKILEDLND